MAEPLAFSIPQKVVDRLASWACEEICLAWGVNDELNKLKDTLKTITILLVDAEEKQLSSKERKITHWLGKLKDVCYDADYVLDEFELQKLRTQTLRSSGSIKAQVHNFFSSRNSLIFRIKMGHRIKRIRKKLAEISNEKEEFGLSERAGDFNGMHINRETHSYVEVSYVIGRDDDRKIIIDNCLNDDCEENVSVISIVGFGGLGKTTLAKLVYNDTEVVEKFKPKMWVCVSDNFDNKKLVREIINALPGEKCGDDSLEQMQTKLRDALKDKKFLLVLDDVWDKEPMGVTITKWSGLKTLLNVGANGSKIIVTTRNETVALLMGSKHVHPLQGLPHKDCMSLFIKVAFQKGGEEQYPHLMKFAEDIVKKCGGVPLALTNLGSLLYLKREVQDWLNVRDNEIWKLEQKDDDILPALRLSYDALPYYLKPCFAYCSLFPKDYKFHSCLLVPMWIAEGFLQSSSKEGNQLQGFEEIGLEYTRQLCARYFFQKITDGVACVSFKMHDLVHDLAIWVAQVECSSMNSRPSSSNANALERVRHLSLTASDFENSGHRQSFLESIPQPYKVRTVLTLDPDSNATTMQNQSFIETCISRFYYLRVLTLKGMIFEELPTSIGALNHLRYLNLAECKMEKLPNSICKLQNLQVLIVRDCHSLKELPKDIGKLISLVHLEITTKEKCLPQGIRSLTSLQVLVVFSCENLTSLGEGIQCLTNLRKLLIGECYSLESFPVNMKALTKLRTLVISDCKKLDLNKSGEGIPNLQFFIICDLNLEALPDWLQDSASTLQILYIEECPNLMLLPEWLQKLTLLQQIVIDDCSELLALPEGMHHLTALRELKISGCPELRKRCKKQQGEDWSKIAHVPNITLDDSDSDDD